MEIFKFLGDIKNAEVTTNVVSENVYPEINGTIILKKGILNVEITWFCRVYPMYQMEDYISVDDLDFEYQKQNIEGLEIDNFQKFRQGLIDHGMQSVADSLTITDELIRNEIYKLIPNHKFYKAIFGDKKLYATLSDEELRVAVIKSMREHNLFRQGDSHLKRRLGWVNEDDTILTNEEILEKYK